MTITVIQLSEAEFADRYPLRTNPLRGGTLFETYGEELAFILTQDPRTIWTLVDGDDGTPLILNGFHYVNRVGYFVSARPAPLDVMISVRSCEEACHD